MYKLEDGSLNRYPYTFNYDLTTNCHRNRCFRRYEAYHIGRRNFEFGRQDFSLPSRDFQEDFEIGRRRGNCYQQYGQLNNVSCVCKHSPILPVSRFKEGRYSGSPRLVYRNHGADFDVSSSRVLMRRRVRKVYAPECKACGVGSDDLSKYTSGNKRSIHKDNYRSKRTSSKCVGGVLDTTPVTRIDQKLSPIKQNTSCSTSPKTSVPQKFRILKMEEATTTPVVVIENQVHVPDPVENRVNANTATVEKDKENTKTNERTEKKSSLSIVERIHNLEDDAHSSVSVDRMENQLEREYMNIFHVTSRERRTTSARPVPEFKGSQSLLRRRFEALRRSLARKEDTNNSTTKVPSSSNYPGQKDVSIASDPPSLEGKSYSDVKVHVPSENRVYIPPYEVPCSSKTAKKKNDPIISFRWPKADDNPNSNVKGMLKLWGKKFNLEEDLYKKMSPNNSDVAQEYEITSDTLDNSFRNNVEFKDSVDEYTKRERKFFFFKKKVRHERSKLKGEVTANRCELKHGLVMNIDEGIENENVKDTVGQSQATHRPRRWINRYMDPNYIDSNNVKIRWNNECYKPSTSTVSELVDSMYKETGLVIRSNSELPSEMWAQHSQTAHRHRVKFIQNNIEAWMVRNTVTDTPHLELINSKENTSKEMTTAPRHTHSQLTKMQMIFNSRTFLKLRKNVTEEYVIINLPQRHYSDSSYEESRRLMINTHIGNESSNNSRQDTDYECKDIQDEIKTDDERRSLDNFETENSTCNVNKKVNSEDELDAPVDPDRCDVIGVGVITQGELIGIGKQKLELEEEITDEDSSEAIHETVKTSELAETLMQDYCRQFVTGVELLSYSSRSESNIFSEFQDSALEHDLDIKIHSLVSLQDTQNLHIASQYDTSKNPQRKHYSACFRNKVKEKFKRTKPETGRVVAKDSKEVCRQRRLNSQGNKGKWGSVSPKCSALKYPKGNNNQIIAKPTISGQNLPPICRKHVSMWDDPMERCPNDVREPPEGILSYKGSQCTPKNSNKHATVIPEPMCEILPPECFSECVSVKKPPCSEKPSKNSKDSFLKCCSRTPSPKLCELDCTPHLKKENYEKCDVCKECEEDKMTEVIDASKIAQQGSSKNKFPRNEIGVTIVAPEDEYEPARQTNSRHKSPPRNEVGVTIVTSKDDPRIAQQGSRRNKSPPRNEVGVTIVTSKDDSRIAQQGSRRNKSPPRNEIGVTIVTSKDDYRIAPSPPREVVVKSCLTPNESSHETKKYSQGNDSKSKLHLELIINKTSGCIESVEHKITNTRESTAAVCSDCISNYRLIPKISSFLPQKSSPNICPNCHACRLSNPLKSPVIARSESNQSKGSPDSNPGTDGPDSDLSKDSPKRSPRKGSPIRGPRTDAQDIEHSKGSPNRSPRKRSPKQSPQTVRHESEDLEETPNRSPRKKSPKRSPKTDHLDSGDLEESPKRSPRKQSPKRSPKTDRRENEDSDESPKRSPRKKSPKRSPQTDRRESEDLEESTKRSPRKGSPDQNPRNDRRGSDHLKGSPKRSPRKRSPKRPMAEPESSVEYVERMSPRQSPGHSPPRRQKSALKSWRNRSPNKVDSGITVGSGHSGSDSSPRSPKLDDGPAPRFPDQLAASCTECNMPSGSNHKKTHKASPKWSIKQLCPLNKKSDNSNDNCGSSDCIKERSRDAIVCGPPCRSPIMSPKDARCRHRKKNPKQGISLTKPGRTPPSTSSNSCRCTPAANSTENCPCDGKSSKQTSYTCSIASATGEYSTMSCQVPQCVKRGTKACSARPKNYKDAALRDVFDQLAKTLPEESCRKSPRKTIPIKNCPSTPRIPSPKASSESKKPPVEKKCSSQPCGKPEDFPWPLKNQNSNQSICKPKVIPGRCKTSCENMPPPPPPPPKCPSEPKCVPQPGIHLKVLPAKSRTCADECGSWNNKGSPCKSRSSHSLRGAPCELTETTSCLKNVKPHCIRINSKEVISLRTKPNTPSTEEIRGLINMKVQDEDGQTLYERRDYRTSREFKQLYVRDVFRESQVMTVKNEPDKHVDLNSQDKDSVSSLQNIVEINFKVKVGNGEKATKMCHNKNETQFNGESVHTTDDTNQVYAFNKQGKHSEVAAKKTDSNDVNIRIVIKNIKEKSDKTNEFATKGDFSKTISEKLHNIAIGYSDEVVNENFINPQEYSVQRTTIDRVSSAIGYLSDLIANKSKSDIKLDTAQTSIHEEPSRCRCTHSDDYIFLSNNDEEMFPKETVDKHQYEVQVDKIYGYAEEQKFPSNTEVSDVFVENNTMITPKPTILIKKPHRTQSEKKTALKRVFELADEAQKSNSVRRIQAIKAMMKNVLTTSESSGSDDAVHSRGKPAKHSESLNNYFQIYSEVTTECDTDHSQTYHKKPTHESHSFEESKNEENVIKEQLQSTCLCSLAAKVQEAKRKIMGAGCGCSCSNPPKKIGIDEGTYCNLIIPTLKTSPKSCVDAITQYSKIFKQKCSKKSMHSSHKNIIAVQMMQQPLTERNPHKISTNNIVNIDSSNTSSRPNESIKQKAKRNKVSKEQTLKADPRFSSPADVLQSYEMKRAVLELYVEDAAQNYGDGAIVKLPKLVFDSNSDFDTESDCPEEHRNVITIMPPRL